MGSSRVPGKSMLDLCGHPVIWHIIQIAKNITGFNSICLATTSLTEDDVLEKVALEEGINIYRGHPQNVLDRLYGAAQKMDAELIIEIGGDCPLLDPNLVSMALEEFCSGNYDYMSNYSPPTFPEGMDINIISMKALRIINDRAIAPSQRIHPFSYITYHPSEFIVKNFEMTPDLSRHHWSLDFIEDFDLIRIAYERLWINGSPINLNQLTSLIHSDHLFNKKDKELLRPKVSHSFWNSPGIIRDMHSDIVALIQGACDYHFEGKHDLAKKNYLEANKIVERLSNEVIRMA